MSITNRLERNQANNPIHTHTKKTNQTKNTRYKLNEGSERSLQLKLKNLEKTY
jgi:hypothetical protein